MRAAGGALQASGVRLIYLVHGTFAGLDAFGLLTDLSRIFPQARAPLGQLAKQLVDALMGDAGNYSARYAQLLEQAINAPGEAAIRVRRFCWTSENHHLGRADGAVRLLAELQGQRLRAGQRMLLWGHSHAGNVFALLTNLLAGDREAIERFFAACRSYYRWPLTGWVDIPVWNDVARLLSAEESPLENYPLDVVTFGTPVRYGWDAAGYSRLLHFIHHRPQADWPAGRAVFPPTLSDVLHAAGGDYVQQIGIAGTNTPPSIFSWRAWKADRALNRLLQPDLPASGLLARLKTGTRCHDEGLNLLVDYGPAEGGFAQHAAGHAVYTREKWMLFHLEETVARWYSQA